MKPNNNFVDLTGKFYGRLTVLRRGSNTRDNKTAWVCLCSCGVEKTIPAGQLKRGHARSCGCLSRELSSERFQKLHTKNRPPHDTALIELFGRYKRAAEINGRIFSLTMNDFSKLVVSNCHYCDSPPNKKVYQGGKEKYNRGFLYSGIDRKDNSIGYTKENSLPCCVICNLGKHTFSYEYFIQYLNQVIKFRKIA